MRLIIYGLCNACCLIKGTNNMIQRSTSMNTCCLATPWIPNDSWDINEKWKQLEENEEPVSLMCWSGPTTFIITMAIVDCNMWLDNSVYWTRHGWDRWLKGCSPTCILICRITFASQLYSYIHPFVTLTITMNRTTRCLTSHMLENPNTIVCLVFVIIYLSIRSIIVQHLLSSHHLHVNTCSQFTQHTVKAWVC
jgi:hypothetical protein